jgi:hypothetical protein
VDGDHDVLLFVPFVEHALVIIVNLESIFD